MGELLMNEQDALIRALIDAATGANNGSLMGTTAAKLFQTGPAQGNPLQGSPSSYVGGGGIPEMTGPESTPPKQGMPDPGTGRPYDFNTGSTDLQFTGEQQGEMSSSSNNRAPDQVEEAASAEGIDINSLTDEELAELVQLMGLNYKPPEGLNVDKIDTHPEYAKYNVGKNPHPALTPEQQAMSGGEIMAQQVKDNQNWKAERNSTGDWKKGTNL